MLFSETVFGPVRSRRLGVSLGINLLPTSSKCCNFDCVYCECGWTVQQLEPAMPTLQEVTSSLEAKLRTMRDEGHPLDVITFAGNGEPTMHPRFADAVEETARLRNAYYPQAKIAVLSNATMLGHPRVAAALAKVDLPALKLDSAIEETFRLINGPQMDLTPSKVVEYLRAFGNQYTLQTLFFSGKFRGQLIDNTTPEEVAAWLTVVEELRPRNVMIYTLDRATPARGLVKAPLEVLHAIAQRVEALGIGTQVRG